MSAGATWKAADTRIGILFIVPFAIAALVFMVFPVVDAVRLAFFHHNPLNPDAATFAGLDNFRTIFDDPLFWQSLRQAAVWTFASIVLQTVFGVALALLLHLPLRGISIFRGLLLFPYIVPTVVIALVLQWMLNPEIGVMNWSLRGAGLIDENIYWLASPTMAMISTIAAQRLEVHAVRHDLRAGSIADHPARALRRGEGRRRRRVAPVPRHHAAAARRSAGRGGRSSAPSGRSTSSRRSISSPRAVRGPRPSTSRSIPSSSRSANLKMGVGAATGVIMMAILFVGSLVYMRVFRFDEEDTQ